MTTERATLESVWATIQATQKQLQENDRILTEKQAETDRMIKETDRMIKNLSDMLGGMGNSNGDFAETYFFNSIDKNKNIFGEHFDECVSSLKRYNKESRTKCEHDIMLINGKSVAIVEVKYKARKDDIDKLINKLPNFRKLYPQYKSHGVYLGLAAMSFEKGVEEETVKNGIAVIKQVGDTTVVCDEHLRVF